MAVSYVRLHPRRRIQDTGHRLADEPLLSSDEVAEAMTDLRSKMELGSDSLSRVEQARGCGSQLASSST